MPEVTISSSVVYSDSCRDDGRRVLLDNADCCVAWYSGTLPMSSFAPPRVDSDSLPTIVRRCFALLQDEGVRFQAIEMRRTSPGTVASMLQMGEAP